MTSGLCACLLLRSARRSSTRLLFWSGISFVFLTFANILLFVDLVILLQSDLLLLRNLITMAAICALLYGLIWETD